MQAKDLRAGPPRRWSERVDGIRWLPRLIDKTRAALAGTLGDYLYGQSPVDRGLLRALGVPYREFTKIVNDAPDDDAVLAALQARSPEGVARARAWSARLPLTHSLFLLGLDVDDGYLGGLWPLFKTPVNACTNPFTRWLKARFPSNATDI
ncbi:MAG: DUF5069 domain-containing protein [Vulcanimicrobiaceae bacterium]